MQIGHFELINAFEEHYKHVCSRYKTFFRNLKLSPIKKLTDYIPD